MKNLLILTLLTTLPLALLAGPRREFYSIRIYRLQTADQESRLDAYLQNALLPALHRMGIADIGVFKPIGNDTAATRQVYVVIPFKTLEQYVGLNLELGKDEQYQTAGKDYIEASYDNPPYIRIESILLQAFPNMPRLAVPTTLQGPREQRIYELRSYEGPTERYYASKVQMFNAGGEIPLFKRLNFNAVFYAGVIAGAHMPNLMYMTSFDNMAARDQHWKEFSADPFWKTLVAEPQYQHNVSHIDIVFLHPAAYSDL